MDYWVRERREDEFSLWEFIAELLSDDEDE